ncbi:MAG: hypothetical protein IV086_17230 [Hyphomonadaceae bacterium]|nr:hypothetical protein [Hyphomonadaceae bacterium]
MSGETNLLLSSILGSRVAACLRDEGIPIVASSLGGRSARRIHYWPATGKALVRVVEDAEGIEKAKRWKVRETAQVAGGSVEFF